MSEQRDREFSREIRRTEAQKEAIESWKRWHREISDALGCEFLERKVTLEKAKDLRTALEQAEKRVRGWVQAYEAAERERDEARGLLRRNHTVLCWLTWLDPVVEDRNESEIRAKQKLAAQIMKENDAHLRDEGD